MREIDLGMPTGWHGASIVAIVEEVASGAGLTVTRGSLRSYPGCTHWHLKKPGSKGTLEATWWPQKERLWLKVHPLREAGWIDAAIEAFVRTFPGGGV
jgi:hypothetical protein